MSILHFSPPRRALKTYGGVPPREAPPSFHDHHDHERHGETHDRADERRDVFFSEWLAVAEAPGGGVHVGVDGEVPGEERRRGEVEG